MSGLGVVSGAPIDVRVPHVILGEFELRVLARARLNKGSSYISFGMPTYVYECASCAKVFEVEQRITENALTDCQCGAKGSLKRLIQPVAVAFKGAGFHINDYAARSEPGVGKQKTADPSKDAAGEKTDTAASTEAGSGKPEATTSGETAKAKQETAASGETGSGKQESPS